MVIVLGAINLERITFADNLPATNSVTIGNYEVSRTGGRGATQAVAASKCGSDVYFFGAVGQDKTGNTMLEDLQSFGINIAGVDIIGSKHSGVIYTTIASSGNYLSTYIPGANFAAKAINVQPNFLHPDTVILLQMEIFPQENWKLIELAKSRGSKVVLHASPTPDIQKNMLKNIDVLVMSATEAATLACSIGFGDNISPDKVASKISKNFNNTCIVTLPNGSILCISQDERIELPPPTTWPLDSSYIMDTLIGTFTAYLDQGYSLPHALAAGRIASGLSACKHCNFDNIPTKKDIVEALKRSREDTIR